MTEGKTANEVQLVTALSDTDHLLATGADGSLKRIAEANVKKVVDKVRITIPNTAPSSAWVRIACNKLTDCPLFTITNEWINIHPIPTLVFVSLCSPHYKANANTKVTVLNVGNYVSKLRVVYPSDGNSKQDTFIEVFVMDTKSNPYMLVTISNNKLTTLYSSYVAGSIPEGYTAKEFDITKTAWGGVNRYAPTSYKLYQKGGQRHDGRKTDYQRPPQRSDVGRDGISWQCDRSRQLQDTWHILDERGYRRCKSSIPPMAIRDCRSDEKRFGFIFGCYSKDNSPIRSFNGNTILCEWLMGCLVSANIDTDNLAGKGVAA